MAVNYVNSVTKIGEARAERRVGLWSIASSGSAAHLEQARDELER